MMHSRVIPHQSINKHLLFVIGLWPHQSGLVKYTLLVIAIFFMTSQSYLQMGGMIAAWQDKDVFLESISPVLVDFVCAAKILNFIGNFKKMKQLLILLEDDWEKFKGCREMETMEGYAVLARKLTCAYAGWMYASMTPFMIIPAVPILMDAFGSSNETHAKQLMFRVDYFLDAEKYYYPLLIHSYFGTLTFITVVVAIDTMILTYVQHARGCFAVLGYQLEHMMDGVSSDVNVYPQKIDDISYHHMVNCIAQHNHALEYSSLIESANYKACFFQLGIVMAVISFSGFQAVMQIDRPEIAVRYAAFTLTQMTLLFLQSFPGQLLYDSSTEVATYVNNCNWYYTSIRTRKLVGLMTLRSRIPSALTAGKFYILNLASYSAVLRTSMSYLTVLTSVK